MKVKVEGAITHKVHRQGAFYDHWAYRWTEHWVRAAKCNHPLVGTKLAGTWFVNRGTCV